jgi:hypothetical protein
MISCRIRRGILLVPFLVLAACATIDPGPSSRPPAGIVDQPPPGPSLVAQDTETLRQAAHYRQIERTYLSQGRLRTDAGGSDAPFGAADLARNAMAIAFYGEFTQKDGKLVAGGEQGHLLGWNRPVRVALEFGPSVPLETRRRDRAEVLAYLSRLSALTGLPMRLVADRPNFLILVVNPPERRGARERILAFAPGTSEAALASVLEMDAATYCTVFGYTPGASPYYERALAVIRAELPDLMRRACLHEEIAQGLGLINDSPQARPSIFNDNSEFALLTRQDELLLRLLYDPRLKPGMSLAEAKPIIETIAAELVAGEG